MEFEAGFDLVPLLARDIHDLRKWEAFLTKVVIEFGDFEEFNLKSNWLEFSFGSNPRLPFEGHKFMRFWSKMKTDSECRDHVRTVTAIAKECFGARARAWNELFDVTGTYTWDEVHQSIATYASRGGPLFIPTTSAAYPPSASRGRSRTRTEDRQPKTPLQKAVLNSARLVGQPTPPSPEPDPLDPLNPHLYSITTIPKRGLGMLARCKIPFGTRIIAEAPLIRFERNLDLAPKVEKDLSAQLKTLTRAQQRTFLSLHNNFPGKYPFVGIILTNGYSMDTEKREGGIFPVACRINHGCIPNAHYRYNEGIECVTIHALRDIEEGEEITVAYDSGNDYKTRKAHLLNNWGFDCDCTLCTVCQTDEQERAGSDLRRATLTWLDVEVEDEADRLERPGAVLMTLMNMTTMIEQEYGGTAFYNLSRVYLDALEVCIMHSDCARAKVFGERAYKCLVISEGWDCLNAMETRQWLKCPAQHRLYGTTDIWATAVEEEPEGLPLEDYESWLWENAE